MAQTKDGAAKIAAQRIGLSLAEYLEKVGQNQKWCYACRQWKSTVDFGIDNSRGDGRKAKCFSCCSVARGKGPSARDRKARKGEGFAWCRDCESWTDLSLVRSGLCKTCKAAYERTRYQSDMSYQRDRKERAHARKRGIKPIPSIGQETLIEEFDGRCAYCPAPANSWDHLVPISKGGQTTRGNIVPCCLSCNSRKKAMDLDDWLERCTDIHPAIQEIMLLANAGLYG